MPKQENTLPDNSYHTKKKKNRNKRKCLSDTSNKGRTTSTSIYEANNKVLAAQIAINKAEAAWTVTDNIADATEKAWVNAKKVAETVWKAGEPITVIKAITAEQKAKHNAEIAAQGVQAARKKHEEAKEALEEAKEALEEAEDDNEEKLASTETTQELAPKMDDKENELVAARVKRENEELEREILYAEKLISIANEIVTPLEQAETTLRQKQKKELLTWKKAQKTVQATLKALNESKEETIAIQEEAQLAIAAAQITTQTVIVARKAAEKAKSAWMQAASNVEEQVAVVKNIAPEVARKLLVNWYEKEAMEIKKASEIMVKSESLLPTNQQTIAAQNDYFVSNLLKEEQEMPQKNETNTESNNNNNMIKVTKKIAELDALIAKGTKNNDWKPPTAVHKNIEMIRKNATAIKTLAKLSSLAIGTRTEYYKDIMEKYINMIINYLVNTIEILKKNKEQTQNTTFKKTIQILGELKLAKDEKRFKDFFNIIINLQSPFFKDLSPKMQSLINVIKNENELNITPNPCELPTEINNLLVALQSDENKIFDIKLLNSLCKEIITSKNIATTLIENFAQKINITENIRAIAATKKAQITKQGLTLIKELEPNTNSLTLQEIHDDLKTLVTIIKHDALTNPSKDDEKQENSTNNTAEITKDTKEKTLELNIQKSLNMLTTNTTTNNFDYEKEQIMLINHSSYQDLTNEQQNEERLPLLANIASNHDADETLNTPKITLTTDDEATKTNYHIWDSTTKATVNSIISKTHSVHSSPKQTNDLKI